MNSGTKSRAKFQRVTADERRARLIEASIECLAKDGIQGFTVDNICREAGTSRGLISHHFGSKNALLAAVYSTIYDKVLANLHSLDFGNATIEALVDTLLSDAIINVRHLNVWLALWAEIAINPSLRAEHRKHYAMYREGVARAISIIGKSRGTTVDSYEVATSFISLVDGLWLEQSIDPTVLSSQRARELCLFFLRKTVQ